MIAAVIQPVKPLTPREERLVESILARKWSFVGNPVFANKSAAAALLAQKVDFPTDQLEFVWNNIFHNLTDGGGRATPPTGKHLLTPDEERTIFLQYNYARFMITKLVNTGKRRSLSIEQKRALIRWYEQVRSAENVIVVANFGLIFEMARRKNLKAYERDIEDIIEECKMTLVRSVRRFDAGKGFKFSTYACRGIVNMINRGKSLANRYRERFPSCSLEEDFTHPSMEVDYEQRDQIEYIREIIDRNLARLTDREMSIIRWRHFSRLGLEECGKMLSITKERVRQIQIEAEDKLRRFMTGEPTELDK